MYQMFLPNLQRKVDNLNFWSGEVRWGEKCNDNTIIPSSFFIYNCVQLYVICAVSTQEKTCHGMMGVGKSYIIGWIHPGMV